MFTYLRLLKLTWKQYRLRFDIILFSHLWISLPINIIIDALVYWKIIDLALVNVTDLITLWKNPWFIAIQCISAISQVWINLCCMLMVKANYQQQVPDLKTIIQTSKHYFIHFFITSCLILLGSVIGFGLFILPGLIIWLGSSLALPALIWKNLTPWQAIVQSFKTTKRYWWIAPGYVLITQLMLFIIGSLLALITPTIPGFLALVNTINQIIHSFNSLVIMVLFVLLEEINRSTEPTVPPQPV